MIQKIEHLSAELKILSIVKWKSPDYREVHIILPWPTQNVATDIAEIGPGRACNCGPV